MRRENIKKLRRKQMIKKFEDLTFTDDFMFCKVMQNTDLCKRLIEMILSDLMFWFKLKTVNSTMWKCR